MNLKELLSSRPSRFTIDVVVDSIEKDERLFDELIDLLLHAPLPIPHMAAWALTVCNEKRPKLVVPYISQLIDNLPLYKHTGIVRMVLRTIMMNQIPENEKGFLFDFCMNCLVGNMPIAVVANSMEILYIIAHQEPDLKNELRMIFEDLTIKKEKGIQSKAKILLRKLEC